MSDIAFICPHCEQPLEAPVEMAGETIECPACGQQMAVPVQEEEPAKEAPAEEDKAVCPSCNSPLDVDSVLCVHCGYHMKLGKRIQTDLD